MINIVIRYKNVCANISFFFFAAAMYAKFILNFSPNGYYFITTVGPSMRLFQYQKFDTKYLYALNNLL